MSEIDSDLRHKMYELLTDVESEEQFHRRLDNLTLQAVRTGYNFAVEYAYISGLITLEEVVELYAHFEQLLELKQQKEDSDDR